MKHAYTAYGWCSICSYARCGHEKLTKDVCDACGMKKVYVFNTDGKTVYPPDNIRTSLSEELVLEGDCYTGFLPVGTGTKLYFSLFAGNTQEFTYDGSFNAFRMVGRDENNDIILKTFTHPHDHSYADGTCTICGLLCLHPDGWNAEYQCGICKAECPHEQHTDGVCDACGKVCAHEVYENGLCSVCGEIQTFAFGLSDKNAGVQIVSVNGNAVAEGESITVEYGKDLTVVLKNARSKKQTEVTVSRVSIGNTNIFAEQFAGNNIVFDGETYTLTIPGSLVTDEIKINASARVDVRIELNGGAVKNAGSATVENGVVTWIKHFYVNYSIVFGQFFTNADHIYVGVFDGETVNTNASYVIKQDVELSIVWKCDAAKLTHMEDTAATCNATGHIEHWKCSCGKLYADANGETELTAEDVTLPIVPDAHGLTYAAQDFVITETCTFGCGHTATATLEGSTNNLTYTGQEIKPFSVSYTGEWLGGELNITYTGNTNVGSGDAVIEVGTAKVSRTFEIKKANPKAEHFVFTAPKELTYDGTEKAATVVLASPYTDCGNITVLYRASQNESFSETVPTNAGTYYVGIHVSGGGNFNAGENITDDSWTFTIAKANPIVTEPAAKTGLVYNGTAQALFTPGTCMGNESINYWFGVNDEYATTVLSRTDAGTYTVKWYAGTDGNGNYYKVQGQMDVTIAPATLTVTPKPVIITYGEELPELEYTVSGAIVGEVPSFEGKLTVDSTEVGIYDIKLGSLKLVDNDSFQTSNYELKLGKGTLTVKQATNSWVTEPNVTDWSYGMEPNIPTADSYFGDVIVEYRPNTGTDADYKTEIPTVPGAYLVRFREEETANWTGLSKVIPMTIETAALYAEPKDQTVTYGKAIDQTKYTVRGLVEGDTATVTLKPSTDKVTTNGWIEVEVVVRDASGVNVRDYYAIMASAGKLVIEPDTSKIDGLTEKNVTSDDEDAIKDVMAQITAGGKEAQEEWKDLTESCEELIEKIEQAEAEKAAVMDDVADFSEETVTSADKKELEALSKDIEDLLDSKNLTQAERTELEKTLEQVQEMTDVLEETAATSGAATAIVEKLDAETVNSGDKKLLEQAVADMDELLAGKNLTEAERKALTDAKAEATAMLAPLRRHRMPPRPKRSKRWKR